MVSFISLCILYDVVKNDNQRGDPWFHQHAEGAQGQKELGTPVKWTVKCSCVNNTASFRLWAMRRKG